MTALIWIASVVVYIIVGIVIACLIVSEDEAANDNDYTCLIVILWPAIFVLAPLVFLLNTIPNRLVYLVKTKNKRKVGKK